MNKHITINALIVVAILAVVGFGTAAFADRGMGYGERWMGDGHHTWERHGPGWHHERWRHGYGNMKGDLSEEDIAALEKERKAFFQATEDLRQDIRSKTLALRSELVKKDPDVKKAQALQKELSDLQAKFDQKKVEHVIEMKKIYPNAGEKYGNGPGSGYGGEHCWR
jgi:Spy/CpxP family protein refolding chaperone